MCTGGRRDCDPYRDPPVLRTLMSPLSLPFGSLPGMQSISQQQLIKASDTLEHQPTVWPVPYACAQPYHPGSGSHGQLPLPVIPGCILVPSATPHRRRWVALVEFFHWLTKKWMRSRNEDCKVLPIPFYFRPGWHCTYFTPYGHTNSLMNERWKWEALITFHEKIH